MTDTPYTGMKAKRILDALDALNTDNPGGEFTTSAVCQKANVSAFDLTTLAPAMLADRRIYVRQKGGAPNSPKFWSLVDHSTPGPTSKAPPAPEPAVPAARSVFEWRGPAQRPEGSGIRVVKNTPQEGANRDLSAEQSHGAEGSDSPAGRGNNVAPAVSAVPAFTPEVQASQQVLKAEAATPDATDRGAPANTSPVGGPMGAGQAAAAAPLAKFALWSTGELSITVLDGDNALSRDGAYTLTLDAGSTRDLCHYLDRLREES